MDLTGHECTAAQLADALSISKQAVRKALGQTPPTGSTLSRGRVADTWSMGALPARIRAALDNVARGGVYRSAAHVISDPPALWRPQIEGRPVTLSEVAEHCLVDAQRLQRALHPSLMRLTATPPPPAAECERKGLAEYREVYGHTISAGHWRRLINRTVERAGAVPDFSRPELYLAAKLKRRVATLPGHLASAMHLHGLTRALSAVNRPSAPTAEELVFIWTQVLDELTWLIEDGTEARGAERTVFAILEGSGIRLALTSDALRKSLRRKLAKWQEGGCKPSAIRDGRRGPRESAKIELPQADREILTARAVERGGRISQAWRAAREAGELTRETELRFITNPASKSHTPRRVRTAIKHDVAQLKDIHHGPRQARLNGAFIRRDYSDIGPGDWMQADDCTLPLYFWDDSPEGVRAMRGQFLPMVDLKTGLILGFALHSDRNYNAAIIRSLITRVHDSYGLPRQGFYFEGGLWERSRLLKGRAANEVTLEETEQGLREFVLFKHARMPKAKIIEGILGLIQNEVEPEIGYCGRNEQCEKFEPLQRKLLKAQAGKLSYQSFLQSRPQWVEKLLAICERYNESRQDGRLNGSSPVEAYDRDFDYKNPLTRLPAGCRYLLANHCRRERVTKNGVRIILSGKPYVFRSADTGGLIGREVLVWHDVEEEPQSVVITDLHKRNPVVVPREIVLPSMSATPERMRAAKEQVAAHNGYARTVYKVIAPHFTTTRFRPVLADKDTLAIGEKIEAGREKAKAEQRSKEIVARRIKRAENATGFCFNKPAANPDRRLRGLEMLAKANEIEQQTSLEDSSL